MGRLDADLNGVRATEELKADPLTANIRMPR